MTNDEGVEIVLKDVGARAHSIASGEYTNLEVLGSAIADFRAIGGITGAISLMTSGKLSANQSEIAKRIVVKLIAVLGRVEAEKLDKKEGA